MAMVKKLGAFTLGCSLVGLMHAEKEVQKPTVKPANAKSLKVVYIDSVNAMRESTTGQIVTGELEAKRKRMADDLQKQEKQFAQEIKEAQDKVAMMSDDAREKEQKRLAKRERDLKAKAQEYEEELRAEMQRATEKLSKELEDAVYEYARAENIDVVTDRVTGRIMYCAVDQEPTEKVVAITNRNHENRMLAEGKKPAAAVAKNDKKPASAA